MKPFKRALAITLCTLSISPALANIIGNWEIRQNGKAVAVVKISRAGDSYQGVIVDGNNYVGTTIITGLKSVGNNSYEYGTITDPTNGNRYSLTATEDGNQLKLRGYLGLKVAGQTQTWYRR